MVKVWQGMVKQGIVRYDIMSCHMIYVISCRTLLVLYCVMSYDICCFDLSSEKPQIKQCQQRACSVRVLCTRIARILRIVVQTGANWQYGPVTDIITYLVFYFSKN